ncbi:Colicin-Ia [Escherichia coli]|nr:Colicin-Ia [Escherichia coli]
MIPQPEVISKKGQGNHSVQNTLSAQQKENENKRTEAGKRLSAAIAAREKENTLKTLRAGNADAADITRQEFRLLQAELREYGFRTEIAGYDALRLHTESRMLFADADSLRISPEAVSLIEQAENGRRMRRTQTRRPLICLLNTSAEKVFWTRGCQSWKMAGQPLPFLMHTGPSARAADTE